LIQSKIPPLKFSQHKGESGKVGIVGGSFEYSGAPFYADLSSLKLGSDLSYIFCTEGAGNAIKSYRPELIVMPFLKTANSMEDTKENAAEICKQVSPWLSRLTSIVIGPGLGRDKLVQKTVICILEEVKKLGLPVVIDGDALYFISLDLNIIKNYKDAILTPNTVEYERLIKALDLDKDTPLDVVCKKLGNVTILKKDK